MNGWDKLVQDMGVEKKQTKQPTSQSGSSGWNDLMRDMGNTPPSQPPVTIQQPSAAPTQEPFQLRMAKQKASENEVRRQTREAIDGLIKSAGGSTQEKRATQAEADKEYRSQLWNMLGLAANSAQQAQSGVQLPVQQQIEQTQRQVDAAKALSEAKQASDEAAAAFEKQSAGKRAAELLAGWGGKAFGNIGNTLLTVGKAYGEGKAQTDAYSDNAFLTNYLLGLDPVEEAHRVRDAINSEEAQQRWGEYRKPFDEAATQGNEYIQQAKDGQGAIGRLAVDLGVGALDLAADQALNAIAPGAGMAAMATRVFGEAAREERLAGGSEAQQLLAGTKAAAIEVLTEKIAGIGGVKGVKPGFVDGLMDKALDRFVENGGNAMLGKLVQAFGSEAAEEMISDLINPLADKALGLNNQSSVDLESLLYDGLVGGLLGMLGGFSEGKKYSREQAAARGVESMNAALDESAAREAPQAAEADASPAEEIAAQAAEISQEGEGDISVPPDTQKTDTGESERLNQAAAVDGTKAHEREGIAQLNIDSAAESGYNDKDKNIVQEVRTDDSGRSDEEAGRGVAPGEGVLDTLSQSGNGSGGNSVSPGVVRVSDELSSAYSNSGVVDYGLNDSSGDSAAYSSALEEGRNSDPRHGWMVTPQTAEDLRGKKLLLAQNGSIGVVITSDGDIEGVFKNQKSGKRGALMTLLPQAIEQGGTKLDCYGEGLVHQYTQYGFIPVARVEFNEQYANPGWDESKGRPFVYVMMHNGDRASEVVRNKKADSYHRYTQAELDALPTYGKWDYDKATAYRDSLLEKKRNGSGTPPAEGALVTPSSPETEKQSGRDYEQAGEKYGVIPAGEKASRESNVPNKMDDATAVGRTARTLYEAKATPEKRLPDIRKAVVDGKFSHVPVGNDVLESRATKKVEQQGWQASLAEFMADVRAGRRNENVVALGAVLLNNAGNSGMSGAQYAELAAAYHQAVHGTARALAAARIMKTLSPEARLYAMTKQVQEINNANAEKATQKRRKKADAKKVSEAAKKAKKSAIEKTANQWAEFGFSDEAAKRVADSIKQRIKNSQKPKTQNALDTFVSYVKKFANEKLDLGRKPNKPMTATELLSEIAQNEDLFREVYEKAQAQFMDENSTGYREFVSDYLNEPVNLSGAEGQRGKLFARAIAESAVATGENVNYIRNQSALGISNGVIAERIASNLIRQTGAQGELADSIRQAANRYVESAVNGDTSDNRTERLVSGMMKNIAARFSEIASQDSATKESIAQDLADQLAIEYGLDPESAKAVADNATEEYNRQLSEAMEKEVARRFAPKEATERQRKEFAQQLSEAINLGAFDSEYAQQAVDKLFGTDGGITLDPALIDKYLAQTTEEGRDDVISEMQQNIADQMPSTFMDKWTAWRYSSMLGNFKTQGRNLIGNTLMGLSTAVKSRVGAAIEAGAAATGKYEGERTKSVWAGRKLYGEAWNDYNNVKDVAEGEGKYQDSSSNLQRGIQKKRTIFKNNGKWGTNDAKTAVGRSAPVKAARWLSDFANKGLEGYRKATNWAMEEGDNIFLRLTYMDALGGYLAANKVKHVSDASPELLERARAYAIKQAQEATFHDSNGLSEWASSFDRGWDKTTAGKVAKTVTQGVLPFRKTPANVLVRAEEYSPVGVFNTFVKAVQAAQGKPGVTGADVIESLSKTLAGSSLAVLGYLLGMAGKARAKGSDDDKLKKLEAEQGEQDYSVTLGDGSSLSLEWAAPASIPFFMGARLAEITDGESPYTILTLLGGVTDPVLQMSMLSGLNDALNNLDKYNGDIEAVPSFMLNSLFSYLTQGMTNSLFGQAEQASEEYRRSTYTDKESPLPSSLQYALSRAGAKTPGIDYNQQDYIDAWGRRVENGTKGERIMSAFFSPAYKKDDRSTEVDDELARLYKETGVNILPTERKPQRSMKINDETLSPEEFEQYSISRGELAYEMIEGFIDSEEYKGMSDQDRAEVIDSLYQFAADQAKKEIARDRREEYKNTDWNKMESLYESDPEDAVNFVSVKKEASNAIESNDYAALDKLLEDGGAYDTLSDDARQYINDSNATLKRLAEMHADGVNAEAGMTAIRAVQAVGGSDAKQNEKVDAIVGTGLTDKEKLAEIKSYTSESFAEKTQAAVDSGVSLDKWSNLYSKYNQLYNDKDKSPKQKGDEWAAILDKDKSLTQKQREVVREQLYFSNSQRYEPKKYDALVGEDVPEDKAVKISDAMTDIDKQIDKAAKIADMGSWMSDYKDADQWAALKVYTSESFYNKAASAYKKGIDLDDFISNFKAVDTNESGDLEQKELYAFYMQNPQANKNYCQIMLAILAPKKDWNKFLREQEKAAKKKAG